MRNSSSPKGPAPVRKKVREKASARKKPANQEKASARKPASASALKTQRAARDREQTSPPPLRAPGVKVLNSAKLAKIPWLLHGFSTRQGGVTEAYGGRQLNLALTAEDSPENVERNRARLLRKLRAEGAPFLPAFGRSGSETWPLVVLNQVHSAAIHRVQGDRLPAPMAGDGLITSARGILLVVKVADCLPVIVADRRRRAVGVFHAGWRGTVQRIVEKGVGEMRRQLGCNPRDLMAAIGPGIGACCYEIGEQVEDEFDSQFTYSKELFEDVFDSWSLKAKYPMLFLNQRAPGHGEPALSRHLDLVKANRRQLLDAGVPEENIEALNLCTACRTDLFFSYRREHVTGRMLAVVGIR